MLSLLYFLHMIGPLLFGLVFGSLTCYIGWRMASIRSYARVLDAIEKQPASGDWFSRYFLGYAFPWQRSMHRAMFRGLGDGLISGFFRLAGVFFILVGIAAYVGFAFIAYSIQTGA